MIDESLVTPDSRVRKLQNILHAKAKAEPSYRFYTLWDKVFRDDVLNTAYRQCRSNKGSHGVDEEQFSDIEAQGVKIWLGKLKEELKGGRYQPKPLRRVWIPKAKGKALRPLSIACIRDRVVQTAMLLVLNPIFEADMLSNQFGFRPKVDAKMAIRRVYYHVTEFKRTEIVDADLKDYFTSIPHQGALNCIRRRIADKRILQMMKQWLEIPVVERTSQGDIRSTEAKDSSRGIAQGSLCKGLHNPPYSKKVVIQK